MTVALSETLSLLNGNCLRHPIPGKWMHALVPNLVFARHHGLLFGLPFLRVVGFFNEHFDPTQVWRWCLCDPGGKKKKKKSHLILSWRSVVTSAVPPNQDPQDHVFVLRLWLLGAAFSKWCTQDRQRNQLTCHIPPGYEISAQMLVAAGFFFVCFCCKTCVLD